MVVTAVGDTVVVIIVAARTVLVAGIGRQLHGPGGPLLASGSKSRHFRYNTIDTTTNTSITRRNNTMTSIIVCILSD